MKPFPTARRNPLGRTYAWGRFPTCADGTRPAPGEEPDAVIYRLFSRDLVTGRTLMVAEAFPMVTADRAGAARVLRQRRRELRAMQTIPLP